MVRHIVFFKFNAEATKEQKDKLAADLFALERKITLIENLEIGLDIGGKDNSFDLALNTEFNNREDVESYGAHPEHVKVIEYIKEVCVNTCKVDYEV